MSLVMCTNCAFTAKINLCYNLTAMNVLSEECRRAPGGLSEVLRVSLPLVAAAVMTSMNGFTDNLFLARHSEAALRAALPANVFAGFVTMLALVTVGYCGTMLARALGSGRAAHAVAIAANGLMLSFASVVLFAAVLPTVRPLLALFGHPPDMIVLECSLLRYLLAGGPVAVAASVAAGFFAGQGHTRVVATATAVGVAVKVALTPVFVFGPGPLPAMGIDGAGASCIASHLATCATYLAAMPRNPLARAAARRPSLLAFRPKLAGEIVRFGLPLCGQEIVGYGSFFALVALIGRLDPGSAAASSAVFAINCPFNAVINGFREGVEILVGRAAGRRRTDEISRTVKSATALAIALSLAYIAALAAFRRPLLGMFLSSDDPNIDRSFFFSVGSRVLLMLMLKTTAEFIMFIFMFALRGIGRTQTIFRTGLVITLVAWLPGLAVVTIYHPTAPAYWFLMVLTSVLGCAIYSVCLRLQLPR